MLLGRKLKAGDNLMQLCIHGGTIKYGDFAEIGSGLTEPQVSDEEENE